MLAPKEQPGSGARPTAIPEHTRSQEPNKYLLADTSKKPVPQQKGQAPVSYLPHAWRFQSTRAPASRHWHGLILRPGSARPTATAELISSSLCT